MGSSGYRVLSKPARRYPASTARPIVGQPRVLLHTGVIRSPPRRPAPPTGRGLPGRRPCRNPGGHRQRRGERPRRVRGERVGGRRGAVRWAAVGHRGGGRGGGGGEGGSSGRRRRCRSGAGGMQPGPASGGSAAAPAKALSIVVVDVGLLERRARAGGGHRMLRLVEQVKHAWEFVTRLEESCWPELPHLTSHTQNMLVHGNIGPGTAHRSPSGTNDPPSTLQTKRHDSSFKT